MHYFPSITATVATVQFGWNLSYAGWNSSIARNASATTTEALSSTATSLPSHSTIKIEVGGHEKAVFSPSFVSVALGTVLQFELLEQNCTLTQSSVEISCSNSSDFNTKSTQPSLINTTSQHIFQHHVNSSNPLWFYCAHLDCCKPSMIFRLNSANHREELGNQSRSSTLLYHTVYSSATLCSNFNQSTSTYPTTSPASATIQKPQKSAFLPVISNNGEKEHFSLSNSIQLPLFASLWLYFYI
jgi:plastocyanin